MLVHTIHIELDGKRINPKYAVLSADIYAEVNRVPWAELTFLDGDVAKRKFTISESGDLAIGTKIKISLGYLGVGGSLGLVFEGIVTSNAVEIDTTGEQLRVECRHASYYMTRMRKSATYPGDDDAGCIAKVLKPYKGDFKMEVPPGGSSKDLELVQFFATDWDFMLSRCEANGWLVVPGKEGMEIVTNAAAMGSVPNDHILDFKNHEVYAMELSIDGSEQYSEAVAQSWDFPTQATSVPGRAPGSKLSPGKVHPASLPGLSKNIVKQLFSGTSMKSSELKAWSKAAITRSRLSFVRGRFELAGTAKIFPGNSVKIDGIATDYNGPAFITAVRHRINRSGWFTDVQVGLPAAHTLQTGKTIEDMPAGGLLPAVNGLQIGVVQAFKKDEDRGEFRVQVLLPAMDKETHLIWARMGMPSAGKGEEDGKSRGLLFWPELGDEVVVGFLNDDPRAAIVLTSVYNTKNAPLYPPDAKNFKSGWTTKSGSKLEFDEEKKVITLSTKKSLELIMHETDELLTIQDKESKAVFKLGKEGISMEFENNKFVMSKQGIEIVGAKHTVKLDSGGVLIDSKGRLDLNGPSGAKMDGGPKVEIKGGMVELM